MTLACGMPYTAHIIPVLMEDGRVSRIAQALLAFRERPMRVRELAEHMLVQEQIATYWIMQLRDMGLIRKCEGTRLAPWEPTERGMTCDLSELPAPKGCADGSIGFLLDKADERRRSPRNLVVLLCLLDGPKDRAAIMSATALDRRQVDRIIGSMHPMGKIRYEGRPKHGGYVLTPKGAWELVCILTGWPIDGYLRGRDMTPTKRRVMICLRESPKLRQEIVASTGMGYSEVSNALTSLVKCGLAEQAGPYIPQRGRRYHLTDEGMEKAEGMPAIVTDDGEIRRREMETLARMLDFTPRAWRDERGIWLKAGTCPMRISEDEAKGLIAMLQEVICPS